LNNQPVVPGMAVFQGDVIQTGGASGAIVNFRSGASATLAESGEVALEWESSPASLNLRQGTLVVQGSSRQPARVHVLGATVMVQGEGEFPAICRIAFLPSTPLRDGEQGRTVGRGAAIFNVRGHVEIHGASAPFLLPGGKFARLEARPEAIGAGGPQAPSGSGQAAGQPAGKVSREIPEETVQRGKATPVALKIQDIVNWEDLIRTLKNGRVQILLLDGSTLNVGARSELKVTKHDLASGQTAIEMAVGKLRADVVKITKPTGSFEVKTQTAVIGVVGTKFVVFATFRYTRVTCLDGLVRVTSSNTAIAGSVTLHAGQFTNVPRGMPPSGVFPAPTPQIRTQISQTTVGGPPETLAGAGAGAGGGGAPGGAGALSTTTTTALNAGTAAAGAATVGTSGAAIAAAGSASSTLSGASSSLSQAASTSSSATSTANSVTTTSSTTTTTVNTITQTVLSPSVPCGCK
jgi:hypothetical protein